MQISLEPATSHVTTPDKATGSWPPIRSLGLSFAAGRQSANAARFGAEMGYHFGLFHPASGLLLINSQLPAPNLASSQVHHSQPSESEYSRNRRVIRARYE